MKVTQLFKGLKTEQKIEQKKLNKNSSRETEIIQTIKKGGHQKKLYITFSWFSKID